MKVKKVYTAISEAEFLNTAFWWRNVKETTCKA
jgi:hypothetical protein